MSLPTVDHLPKLEELDLEGQRVLVRIDTETLDDTELLALQVDRALPTLHLLLSKGARVIVASHSPPKGDQPAPSLEPVGALLAERLTCEVYLPEDCAGDMARKVTSELRTGQVALLENLASDPGELQNDDIFARKLAALCEVFVNDAPSLFERKLASLSHLPRLAGVRTLGLEGRACLLGLRLLEGQRGSTVCLLATPTLNHNALTTIQAWLGRVGTVMVVGEGAMAFAAATPGRGDTHSRSAPSDAVTLARSLLANKLSQNKKLRWLVDGSNLEQELIKFNLAGSPLLLRGPMSRAGLNTDVLSAVFSAHSELSACGSEAVLDLHHEPALLTRLQLACISEPLALRTLAGETLPALAALAAAV